MYSKVENSDLVTYLFDQKVPLIKIRVIYIYSSQKKFWFNYMLSVKKITLSITTYVAINFAKNGPLWK